MNLPIIAYGNPVLKQKCSKIDRNTPTIQELIDTMWETMKKANGCGLSASQIGKPLQIFVVDSKTVFDNMDTESQLVYFEKGDRGIIETFINAKIIHQSDETWEDYEGCLSIPGLSQKVQRSWQITIEYYDKDFSLQTKTFSGMTARVIQHEYDHTQGILYTDRLKPFTRKMIESKLKKISNGGITVGYPMKFL